jgi:signal transduction histidine kinase/ligand-binding sensor domain-containing protein/DNA-binding response OmpR family regulator
MRQSCFETESNQEVLVNNIVTKRQNLTFRPIAMDINLSTNTKIALLYIIFSFITTQADGNQIWFRYIDNETGLSHNTINAILRDSKGFVWLGTPRGLSRYDGSGFKTYLHSTNANSISNNTVTAIEEDQSGNLWIATENGLNFFDRKTNTFRSFNVSNGLLSGYIKTIHLSKSGTLYIGTSLGLCKLENAISPSTSPVFNTIEGTQSRSVFSIAEDNLGHIWTGYVSEPFVSEYIPTDQRLLLHALVESGKPVISFSNVFIDKDNTVWTASLLSNLSKYDKASEKFIPVEAKWSNPDTEVRDIKADESGTIWISTIRQGIVQYNKNNNTGYSLLNEEAQAGAFFSNSCYSIHIDNQGIVWIGTESDGVAFNHPSMNRFKLYRKSTINAQAISDNRINHIIVDNKERIWIGTDNGINILQKNSNDFRKIFNNVHQTPSISSNSVTSLLQDKQGIFWVGTFQGGLNRYDEKTQKTKHFRHNPEVPNSLCMDNIWTLYEDSKNNLWVGTLGAGLDLIDHNTNSFKHFTISNTGLSSNYISQIIELPNGDLWLATVYGINVLGSDHRLKKIYLNDKKNDKSISSNHICCMFIDTRKNLWIGTIDGLNKYNPDTDDFTSYKITDNILGNTINSILEDDEGFLWISSLNGLYKLQITSKPNEPIALEQLNHYDVSDGLQGKEFSKGCACKTPWGELYFGGAKGLTSFFPHQLINVPKGFNVIFTDLQIFNNSIAVGEEYNNRVILEKSMEETQEIILKYDENIFNIALSTPDLVNPNKAIFSYKLEGFSDEWITLEPDRKSVSFTNLNPGKYILKVKATNSDGEWLDGESRLNISITPPFWKSKLAFLILFSLAIMAIVFLWKTITERTHRKMQLSQQEKEIKRQRELDEMKMSFFTNVSHEFRTPLTLMLSPIESLEKTTLTHHQNELLGIVQKNAQKLLNLINQLLDLRKTEAHELTLNTSDGDIILFLKEIVDSFKDYTKAQGIQLTVASSTHSFHTSFDREKIERSISNLISNAIKFTPKGGNISLEMEITPIDCQQNANKNTHLLKITITDTGFGIKHEDREHIFKPFYQAKLPNTANTSGYGIGLSMVEKYIKTHGGDVVLSESGEQGSKFTITLPMQQLNEKIADIEKKSKTNPELDNEYPETKDAESKPTILLVEDNKDLRRYLTISFGESYKIIEACNGKQGIELAMEHIPTIIISDVMMPEIDGLALCQKLKSERTTSHIPIILLSAKNAEQHKIIGYDMGADDYITKPFNMELLQHKVRILIDKQIQSQQKMVSFLKIEPSQIAVVSMDEKLVKKAIETIEENMSNAEFSVELLAREIGMSRVHLYKKILAITGKSPVEFIRIIRLKRAAQLLKESQLTISEIAYEVGFNNPRYFSKHFKDEFGMLPSKYCDKYGLVKNRQHTDELEDEQDITINA